MGSRSRRLTVGMTALMDMVNSGGPGLPALDKLLDIAQEAMAADGMAAFELADGDGRIVAASGAASFALGRRIDAESPRALQVRSGPRVQELALDGPVHTPLGADFRHAGISRIITARVEISGRAVGALLACYRLPTRTFDEDEHLIMDLLGAAMGHLYSDSTGLPVHGASRVAARPTDLPDRELFMAVASHELRTPVTVIKGYADTLTRHWHALTEAERLEAAIVISQRSSELARLVDRLMTTATVGAPGSVPGPFDLRVTLAQAVKELPADLRRRLDVRLPAHLPPARGERGTMVTVLTELVTNAHKYSPGTELVELTAGADERTVYFQVADRGVGVSPEDVELVFDRFWRGHARESRRSGGAGLGLYLVRKTIERQNGWVSLHPRDGGGTVAEVRLPRGDQPWSGEA